jgi:redox-sensing transcriptional repressor
MKKVPEQQEFDITGIPAIADRATAVPDEQIPDAVIKRLPRYFRCLRELYNRDIMKISSTELSEITGLSAPQLRQDLKYFGGLGQRGYGYNVKKLYTCISEYLGVGKKYTAVIIGAGNLGKALSNSRLLEQRGVWIKGVFDISDKVIGRTVADNTVRHVKELKEFCKNNRVDIAVLCIPANESTELCDIISGTGVRGVWNFSPCEIDEKAVGVPVVNICAADSLMILMREMSEIKDKRQ